MLEGGVAKPGGRVRITAQLIDTAGAVTVEKTDVVIVVLSQF